MKIDLTVENGPCNTDLRSWCLGIAIYWLLSMTFNVIFAPNGRRNARGVAFVYFQKLIAQTDAISIERQYIHDVHMRNKRMS